MPSIFGEVPPAVVAEADQASSQAHDDYTHLLAYLGSMAMHKHQGEREEAKQAMIRFALHIREMNDIRRRGLIAALMIMLWQHYVEASGGIDLFVQHVTQGGTPACPYCYTLHDPQEDHHHA